MGAPLDLRIEGGTIMDGSGQPGVRGSVGVRDGKIVAVGEVSGDARERIDAGGMIVAPGFIDVHTHYDAQAFWDPTLSPSSRFGVTTVIAGNCGFSIAPLSGKADDTEYLMRMLARVEGMPLEALRAGVPWDWRSFEEYLARIDGTLAINAGFMVGHSAMRRAVMGSRAIGQAATAAELSQMQALLRTSLAAGGMGLSTTMSNSHLDGDGNPVPSRFATREEMIGLAGILAEFEGTTLEFEPTVASEFSEDLVKLMTDMSLAAGRLLNWNTLLPDSRMPNLYRSHLAASDYAAARGARIVPLVAAQQNTLTVNFISAFILASYPGWGETMRLPLDARKKALMDPAIRRQLDEGAHSPESGHGALTSDWPKWVFAQIHHPDNKHWEGKKVGEVAESLGKAPFDVLLDVVIADDLKTLLVMPQRGATEESWEMLGVVWKDERTIIGSSDAGAHLDLTDAFVAPMQLLSVGVRKRGMLSLQEAVRQLTSVPAGFYGLRDRGMLKAGYCADIVVFDPATVGRGPIYMRKDLPADAQRLYADAVGVHHVFVNGREIVRNNEFRGSFPGKILRSGKDSYTVPIPANQGTRSQ